MRPEGGFVVSPENTPYWSELKNAKGAQLDLGTFPKRAFSSQARRGNLRHGIFVVSLFIKRGANA